MFLKKIFTNYLDKVDRESILAEILRQSHLEIKKALNIHNRLTRKWKIKNYFKSHNIKKIQFGSGGLLLKNFLNTDLLGKIPIDISKKLPFTSDSVDLIYSNHVIEHIYNRQFKYHLRETYRILKKGGIFIIATPSLSQIINALYNDDKTRRIILDTHKVLMREELDVATFLNRMIHLNYGHKFLYDFESLSRLAKIVGFKDIKIIPNYEIPDKDIMNLLIKSVCRNIETGTYLLTK